MVAVEDLGEAGASPELQISSSFTLTVHRPNNRSGASVDGSDFFASFGQEDNDARENPSQDSSQDWNDDFASKKQAPARSRSGASRVSSKPKASIKPKGNDDDWGNDW